MTSSAHPGLQPERTALAWRRTALSVTVGSLVGLRVLPPQLGALGYAVSALGLLWALDLLLTARRRYRDGARMLRADAGPTARGGTPRDPAPPGPTTAGAAMARTAAVSALVGLAALVAVVVLSTR